MFFAEGAVVEHLVAFFKQGDAGAEFDDLADAHIAQTHRVFDAFAFVIEDAQFAVKAAARAGIALELRHLGAVFGCGEQAFDADLALCKGDGFVFLEGGLFLGGCDQFSGHGVDLLTQGAVLGFIWCGCKKRNIH